MFNELSSSITKFDIYCFMLIIVIPLAYLKKISYFHNTSEIGFYVNLSSFIIIAIDCITILFKT